jgi:hypothetical protein
MIPDVDETDSLRVRRGDIERLYTMLTILASGLMMRIVTPDNDDYLDLLADAGSAMLSHLPQSHKDELIRGLKKEWGRVS